MAKKFDVAVTGVPKELEIPLRCAIFHHADRRNETVKIEFGNDDGTVATVVFKPKDPKEDVPTRDMLDVYGPAIADNMQGRETFCKIADTLNTWHRCEAKAKAAA